MKNKAIAMINEVRRDIANSQDIHPAGYKTILLSHLAAALNILDEQAGD